MARGRAYESAIADSPVRHALFNRPFTMLRKRTEVLLDSITGGTLPPEVLEQERRTKETDRLLKCRGCRVLFGDEQSLTRHYNLFPAHIHPPEHKRPPSSRAVTRAHRSQSTPDSLSTGPAVQTRPTMNHIQSSRLASSDPTTTVLLASDFYAVPSAEILQAPASAFKRLPETPHLPVMADREPEMASSLPTVAPLLPALDFGTFQIISQEGEMGSPSKARPVTRQAERKDVLPWQEERNVAAGAASAGKVAARREGEEQRRVTRTESESALDRMTTPPTFKGVVRSVVATAGTGAGGAAVGPMSAAQASSSDPSYVALAGEDVAGDRGERGEATGPTNWSALFSALPGAPEAGKERKAKAIEPIATGLTSFSNYATLPTTPSSSPPNLRRLLPRRNTNPFLNEAFMKSLPSAKTPPLSPSSPFATYSPGNPFARLAEPEEDEEGAFYDALDTPGDAFQSPTRRSRNPFFSEDGVLLASSSPVDQTQGLGLSKRGNMVNGVADVATKLGDEPKCPSCCRAFPNLEGVLDHLNRRSDCTSYNLAA